MQLINTDILIIGAGGAGLQAALSAHETDPNLKITVITRGEPGRHGVTSWACSDRMAFHVSFPHSSEKGPESWRAHAMDIYAGGGYVSDPNLAEILARGSTDAFYRLADLGVAFARGPGNRPAQFVTDGSKTPRACYTGPYTARDIEKALLDAVKKTGTELIGGFYIASLITDPKLKRVTGAICIEENSDEWVAISARAVILATGGPGGIFEHNVFPGGMDASAWWAALNAGATLVNTEFIQFGISSFKTGLACSGSLMRALPRLCGDNDRDLLSDVLDISPEHDPIELLFNKGASWPVSAESPTRAVDIAVARALSRGENVRLDYTRNPDFVDAAYLNRRFPNIIKTWYTDRGVIMGQNGSPTPPIKRLDRINPQVIQWFSERGVDLSSEPVEIRHAAQHFQGGVLINTKAETGVPGLYACGECAGGQHGANRPGGNALMDCQVMGHIAGNEAASHAAGMEPVSVESAANEKIAALEKEFAQETGANPGDSLQAVRKTLSSRTGVIRTTKGLRESVDEFSEMHQSGVKKGDSWVEAISAKSAQTIGLAIAMAASERQESRGAHLFFTTENDDKPMPQKDPDGRVWHGINIENGVVLLRRVKIPTRQEKET